MLLGERNTFSEEKVSQGNAIVLRENTDVLQEKARFLG